MFARAGVSMASGMCNELFHRQAVLPIAACKTGENYDMNVQNDHH